MTPIRFNLPGAVSEEAPGGPPSRTGEASVARSGALSAGTAEAARNTADVTGGASRWGLVLAGGDGVRLRSLTRFVCGDDRPKQFCPLFSGKTLLARTLERAVQCIPAERIAVSLAGEHFKFYSGESGLSATQRIVQPMNRGTAPAIIHGLHSIACQDPQALVAILPSDHHYADEGVFAATLEDAFELAGQQPESVVLVGARPERPETEYGWIELGDPLAERGNTVHRVRTFREKPKKKAARELFARGAVWNTFVMVGSVRAFLDLVEETVPDLLRAMRRAPAWAGAETRIEAGLYLSLAAACFSREVLSAETGRLLVLHMIGSGWSDLGDPQRATSAILGMGAAPDWLVQWKRANQSATAGAARASAVA